MYRSNLTEDLATPVSPVEALGYGCVHPQPANCSYHNKNKVTQPEQLILYLKHKFSIDINSCDFAPPSSHVIFIFWRTSIPCTHSKTFVFRGWVPDPSKQACSGNAEVPAGCSDTFTIQYSLFIHLWEWAPLGDWEWDQIKDWSTTASCACLCTGWLLSQKNQHGKCLSCGVHQLVPLFVLIS